MEPNYVKRIPIFRKSREGIIYVQNVNPLRLNNRDGINPRVEAILTYKGGFNPRIDKPKQGFTISKKYKKLPLAPMMRRPLSAREKKYGFVISPDLFHKNFLSRITIPS